MKILIFSDSQLSWCDDSLLQTKLRLRHVLFHFLGLCLLFNFASFACCHFQKHQTTNGNRQSKIGEKESGMPQIGVRKTRSWRQFSDIYFIFHFLIFLSWKKTGYLSIFVLTAMLLQLKKYTLVPRVKAKRYKKFFKHLSADKEHVTMEQFLELHEIYNMKFTETTEPKLHTFAPRLFHSTFGRFFVAVFSSRFLGSIFWFFHLLFF